VTAGNASGITDGAAALVVASEEAARELGLEAAGYLVDWEVVGVDPRIMGIGPVPAVRNLLGRRRLTEAEIEEVELNEAFASQVLACLKELPLDPARVNPDGGAIALGHPIGATGARILVTLLHGMAARERRRGIATLCVSGGMGLAALIER
jgi:acetyl-CoA acetyltransferase family protein